MNDDDMTVRLELTTAQARVATLALDAYEALLDGGFDGARRSPWSAFEMDSDEGGDVPAALTNEAGFRSLLDNARHALGKAASQS